MTKEEFDNLDMVHRLTIYRMTRPIIKQKEMTDIRFQNYDNKKKIQ